MGHSKWRVEPASASLSPGGQVNLWLQAADWRVEVVSTLRFTSPVAHLTPRIYLTTRVDQYALHIMLFFSLLKPFLFCPCLVSELQYMKLIWNPERSITYAGWIFFATHHCRACFSSMVEGSCVPSCGFCTISSQILQDNQIRMCWCFQLMTLIQCHSLFILNKHFVTVLILFCS